MSRTSQTNPIWLLLALLVLGLPAYLCLGSVAADWLRATPEPTAVPLDLAACLRSEEPQHHPSPDGRFCAVEEGLQRITIAARNGRQAQESWAKLVTFDGWTADSRYALFSRSDQYHNSQAWAFDTEHWQAAPIVADEDCFASMSGDCRSDVAAMALTSSRVLLRDGRLVRLPHSVEANLLQSLPEDFVITAGWSPDEALLALLASNRNSEEAAVYLWREQNGSQTAPVRLQTVPAAGPLEEARFRWQLDGSVRLSLRFYEASRAYGFDVR